MGGSSVAAAPSWHLNLLYSPHRLRGSPQLEGRLPEEPAHAWKERSATGKAFFFFTVLNLSLPRPLSWEGLSARSRLGSVLCRYQIRVESFPFLAPFFPPGLQT